MIYTYDISNYIVGKFLDLIKNCECSKFINITVPYCSGIRLPHYPVNVVTDMLFFVCLFLFYLVDAVLALTNSKPICMIYTQKQSPF